MDCRTGEIYEDQVKALAGLFKESERKEKKKHLISITAKQYEKLKPLGSTKRKNYMRNKPCVGGSGKKFKKCCWGKYA